VEKSPRLNWATQYLTVAYDGSCSPNVSVRRTRRLALQEKKVDDTSCLDVFLNRARRLTRFLSAPVTRKSLQFGK
jgi:hypothetical protein